MSACPMCGQDIREYIVWRLRDESFVAMRWFADAPDGECVYRGKSWVEAQRVRSMHNALRRSKLADERRAEWPS